MSGVEMNRAVGKESDGNWTITKPVTEEVITRKLTAKAQEPEHSKKSTEEMLEHILRMNNEILSKCKDLNDFAERYIASVDVKALYVEIKPDRAGEEIYESIVEGDWSFDVNTDELSKYIAVNWS